jgi:RNA polymerase primary sigma factor
MSWSDPKLQDLARQLAFTPAQKRREQLQAAVEFLERIDAGEEYPWEYILFRITGYRSRESVDHQITGRTLLADLAHLVEHVSETLEIRTEEAGDAVLSLDQVTARFNVSSKTIQRWRRRGLVAMRYVYSDGVKRIGFRQRDLETFNGRFSQRVAKSARFRQLSEEEKDQIIRRARRLAARCHCCIKVISRRIGRRMSRSPETIRYVIRRYDLAHPQEAIFPVAEAVLTEQDRRIIADCFERGISVDCLARRYCRTRSSIYRLVGEEKARRIKNLEIRVVANPLFDHPDAEQIIMQVLPAKSRREAALEKQPAEPLHSRSPNDIPVYLADAFTRRLMPRPLMVDAFRRMNYLKNCASRLQAQLNPATARAPDLERIEKLLSAAAAIRDEILQSHLRVVVHVARKHQQGGEDLFELISDGNLWLMRAVDNFDFSRNVAFNTYLTYVLMKNFAHRFGRRPNRAVDRLLVAQDDLMDHLGDESQPSVPDAVDMLLLQGRLVDAMGRLPRRERDLVAAHYGLAAGQSPSSLSQIAEQMHITKARVRQLEVRALRRLRRILAQPQHQTSSSSTPRFAAVPAGKVFH